MPLKWLRTHQGNLGISLQRSAGSQSFIISLDRSIYKLAYTIAAYKQLKHEYLCNIQAREDIFWSSYVVPLQMETRLFARTDRQFQHASIDDLMLGQFINTRYQWLKGQKKLSLGEALKCSQLEKYIFPRLESRLRDHLEMYMKRVVVEVASIHGDFHLGNIFYQDKQLLLIDWGNYRRKFWGAYDLVHLVFCEWAKKCNCSWTDLVVNYPNQPIAGELVPPFKLTDQLLACYTLARCELEISQDVRLHRLKSRRVEKYQHVIERLVIEL